MTSHRIGVNLRVSGNCDQGARKYMEDNHVIKFLKKDTDDYEFAYFGIFDGHGGPEASVFCKDHLLSEITKYDGFWTDDDQQVLAALRKGFLDTHNAMWNVLDSWPKTVTGLPSTAGSTATIAIIKQGKLYTGHVGDSALVLGENKAFSGDEFAFQAICITKEHKPDDPDERLRIEDAGGEVISKSGVPRVVWSRPKTNHKGPVRRSTQIDQIPFLAVARSLGDLWSYDYYTETYVVSPDPDVAVMKLDPSKHHCLILASDGLWNMLTPEETVNVVMDLETQFEQKIISDPSVSVSFWSNPAERLVSRALNKWRSKSLKADNTSCVVVLIDPLGPSKLTLLKQKRQQSLSGGEITTHFSKVPKLSIEPEHRNRARNKNANCSFSDSHFRTNDDSILQLIADQELVALPAHGQSITDNSKPELKGSGEDSSVECLKDGVQTILKPPVKWNLRRSIADRLSMNSNNIKHSSVYSKKMTNYSQSVCPNESLNRKSEVVFTKLFNGSNVTNGETENARRMKLTEKIRQMNSCQLIENFHDDFLKFLEEKIEIEENEVDFDSDFEKLLPESPLCSSVKKLDVNESGEDSSLHSSADVTNKAFSLASNESIESPQSSFSGDSRPPTPLSAPAKLSHSRARRSSQSKKQHARNGRKLKILAKPLSGVSTKPVFNVTSSVANLGSTVMQAVNSCSKTGRATSSAQDNINRNEITELLNTITAVAAPALAKSTHTKTQTNHNQTTTSFKHTSLPQQVVNISKSVCDVFTPSNQKKKLRSVSFTGLTPDINLMLKVPKSALKKSVSSCTTNVDVTNQLLSSLMAADTADPTTFTTGLRKEASMIIDDKNILYEPSMLTWTGPLKQLNKTGPVRKISSKRWGHFFNMSKHGVDKIFHQGSHSKGSGKSSSTLAGSLGCDSSMISDNNAVSDSQFNDTILTHHLPDVTVSHLADITVDASVAVDNLTNLSALSEDNSIFAGELTTTIHHSMLGESLPGKTNKHRKSFIQKTKLTLRRASKAAKKAFFPENDSLFHKVGRRKRRSSETGPTPEMKRQKQLQTNRT